MAKELIVNATALETRLAILEDDQPTEIFIERRHDRSNLGNIYKGKVMRVLPGMQAAFVDIGLDRNAFLYVTDFFRDYDDYEEVFEETDRAIEDFLKKESEDQAEPPKTRVRRARGSGRRRGRGKRAPAPQPQPAEVVKPIPYQQHSLETLQILPESLSLRTPVASLEPEDDPDAGTGILPRRFELRSSGSRLEELEGREARLDDQPDIHQLATSRASNRKGGFRRRGSRGDEPLIGDLLKQGQEILVQIAKEPIASKGARITSRIVLPGRFLVFMPTVDHVGVSRKIESVQERQRLKQLLLNLRGDIEKGFIVRTAGEGKQEEDFKQDMIYLTRVWEKIRSKAETARAPALIHGELSLVQRVIRDYFSDDYRSIRVDEEETYQGIVEFVSNFNPKLVKKVKRYRKKKPIFDDFEINPEIQKALQSKVWLKTGGYIVVNQTEALVAIDVNTGKYVGKTTSLEDTITKTNLDAVHEVVRQIRLRDLGGIIIIDFIDMNDPKNRQKVMNALQHELSKDKSPSKILQFNEFGLVAITRKRVKKSLERMLCQPCIYCEGTGMTRAIRTICYTIYNQVRDMRKTLGKGKILQIRCHPDVERALKGNEKMVVNEIEKLTGKEVLLQKDPLIHIEKFELVEK